MMSNGANISHIDFNPNRQNIKFEQFMIRFDMLTQKHYESYSTRSEIETKANDIQLTPK